MKICITSRFSELPEQALSPLGPGSPLSWILKTPGSWGLVPWAFWNISKSLGLGFPAYPGRSQAVLWGCQCLLTSKPEPMRGMGLTCHICGDLIYKKWIVFLGLAFWTTEVGGQRGSQGSLLSSRLQAFASFWAWPAPVGLPDSSSSHSGSESHGLKQFVSGCRPSLLCQPIHVGTPPTAVLSLSLQHGHMPHSLPVTFSTHTITRSW